MAKDDKATETFLSRRIELLAAMIVASATLAHAQSRPDLTGRWVLVPDPGSDPARVRIVMQDNKSLGISDWSSAGREIVYPLNETASQPSAGRAGVIAPLRWTRDALTIETVVQDASSQRTTGQTINRKETWSFDSDGRLVIDIVEGRAGALSTRQHLVYRRQ